MSRQFQLESSLDEVPASLQVQSWREAYIAMKYAPDLVPIRYEARFNALVDAISQWDLVVYRCVYILYTCTYSYMRLSLTSSIHGTCTCTYVTCRSDPASHKQYTQVSTLPPQQVIRNRQSLWIRFAVPSWMKESPGQDGHKVLLRARDRSDSTHVVIGASLFLHLRSAHNRLEDFYLNPSLTPPPPGHTNTEDSHFVWPASDTHLMEMSHTTGFYPWGTYTFHSFTSTPIYTNLNLSISLCKTPHTSHTDPREGEDGVDSDPPDTPSDPALPLQLMAYVHFEQLVPSLHAVEHGQVSQPHDSTSREKTSQSLSLSCLTRLTSSSLDFTHTTRLCTSHAGPVTPAV